MNINLVRLMLLLDECNWEILMSSWLYKAFMRSEIDSTGSSWKQVGQVFWGQNKEGAGDTFGDVTERLKTGSKGFMLLVLNCSYPNIYSLTFLTRILMKLYLLSQYWSPFALGTVVAPQATLSLQVKTMQRATAPFLLPAHSLLSCW